MTLHYLFVDGLGAGRRDAERNPCLHTPHRLFASFSEPDLPSRDQPLPFSGLYLSLDAHLGVEGTPQSATGQTTLFTGVNAAKFLGFHLWAFPNSQLREVLANHSIHRQLTEKGKVTRFANAFRGKREDLPQDVWTDPRYVRMIPASVWANRAAGNPFFGVDELRADRAVSFDLTNQAFRDQGLEVPLRTPERAGEVLALTGKGLDLCLFEYFQTDKAGHKEGREACSTVLTDLESFVLSLLSSIDLTQDTVLLTSDHGNIEDVPSHGHTHNPSQTCLWGKGAKFLAEGMTDLSHVTPRIVAWLEGQGPEKSRQERVEKDQTA